MLLAIALFVAAELPRGAIVDEVHAEAGSAQHYSLYLPANYTPDRAWPLILAFDPRGRGRTPVERYQAAAEKYGYIVAGSNVSRNGSWAVSMKAAEAMGADVNQRFKIDARRVYTAGMSGGARVAMGIAMGSDLIAGVVASSAGYPDSQPRKTLPFVVFGTAGTEDFNYHELRELDRTLTTPHRVAIFAGGHVWLSSELATEAVEWLQLQAMASGRAPRDTAWIESMFQARLAAADALHGAAAVNALDALAADFKAFQDVSPVAARAAALRKQKPVRDALKSLLEEDRTEERRSMEFLELESRLPGAERTEVLGQLRAAWKHLAKDSAAPADSPTRRVARRLMRNLAMSAGQRTEDPEYRKLVMEFAPPLRGRPGV